MIKINSCSLTGRFHLSRCLQTHQTSLRIESSTTYLRKTSHSSLKIYDFICVSTSSKKWKLDLTTKLVHSKACSKTSKSNKYVTRSNRNFKQFWWNRALNFNLNSKININKQRQKWHWLLVKNLNNNSQVRKSISDQSAYNNLEMKSKMKYAIDSDPKWRRSSNHKLNSKYKTK